MKVIASRTLPKGKKNQTLIFPFWQGKKKPEPAQSMRQWETAVHDPIAMGDFSGKEGETCLVYPKGKEVGRIILLGLGEKERVSEERLRRAFGRACETCQKLKADKVALLVPDLSIAGSDGIESMMEGLSSINYFFLQLKNHSLEEENRVLVDEVSLIGASDAQVKRAQAAFQVMEGVYLARDLINGNADDVTPQHIAKVARDVARRFPKVKTTVFDKARIEKEKMGLLLAVSRASPQDPVFIIATYNGNPRSKDHTVIVGKGITFDTGGLNLKPTGSMETMKRDMSGAAVALGTLYAAANSGLKRNLTVVIPSTENGIDAKAYKPGDVYAGCSGKTVEIGNTDAEGRLVLADALAYTEKKIKPSRIIDVATLTGAIVIGLGHEVTGMMSNDDNLAKQLYEAGEESFERVWRLPLYDEYRDQIKSDVADIKSTGGRAAGSITAAMFLKEFVNSTPWAHLDIAGTAYEEKKKRYYPPHATGVGIRLLYRLLNNLS